MQSFRLIHQLFTWYEYKGKHGSGLWDNAVAEIRTQYSG